LVATSGALAVLSNAAYGSVIVTDSPPAAVSLSLNETLAFVCNSWLCSVSLTRYIPLSRSNVRPNAFSNAEQTSLGSQRLASVESMKTSIGLESRVVCVEPAL
jgi:hypothetical protein